MKRLENKVALITGAAGGQGKEEAILFSKQGAKLVITDVNIEQLNMVANKIRKNGGKVIALEHDVSSEESWFEVVSKTKDKYGELHVLINNAGILSREDLMMTDLEKFEQIQSVNSRGTYLGMRSVAPLMKESGGGSVINISSIYGLVGSQGSFAYHASKGSIRLMSKAAAVSLSKDFIRVNSIHPGVIVTQMSDSAREAGEHPLKNKTPWPRLGRPIDVAYGALYLASDESCFITGSELVIDGGYTAQ